MIVCVGFGLDGLLIVWVLLHFFTVAVSEPAGSDEPGKGLDVNRFPMVVGTAEEAEDAAATLSSPNSTVSSFQMDFGVRRSRRDLDLEVLETERASSRASDDDENGSTRKKLRLSKDQSAFLEESFKEHSTLNPVSQKAKDKTKIQYKDSIFFYFFCYYIRYICNIYLLLVK